MHTGTRGTLSCATATLTLTGAGSATSAKAALTGKTCTWTPTSGSAVSAFFGRGGLTGAGTLANLTGSTAKAFLTQRADGTVRGGVFAGMRGTAMTAFAVRERDAASDTGHCDHH